MSALGDVVAAILPPEGGGPEPERVASVARRMVSRMPAASQAGLGAALVGIEAFSLARTGRRLGRASPERREELLKQVARLGGSPALDAVKSIVMLAHGAEAFAGEIAAVGSRHEPSRPDQPLTVIPGAEWPGISSCDAIVVGSGAGGAFVARELARAGLDTVIVEEGERWTVERIRGAHPLDRFVGIYRDGGTTTALGNPPIALPLGRAVGGTTVINSGTCFQPPAAVAAAWHQDHGLALAEPELLGPRVADVEATIGVAPAPMEVLGRNGELALEGAAALDWSSAPLRRNAPGCRGACQCAIGCPNNAKGGVHLNALPQACEAGARIVSGLHVKRVLTEGGLATGVLARRAGGGEVRISAPLVVVAAGAIPTPPLLRRSGLGSHPRLGRNLSIHPATGITASFEEEVVPWSGVMQSVGIEELHEREGVLIEATGSPPGMGAISAPGYGTHLLRRLDRAANTATLGAMIADEPSGRVFGSRAPIVSYRLAQADERRLAIAIEAMARVMLAAGAREVELAGGVAAVRSEAELASAMQGLDVRRLRLAGFHPTGSAAAGSDPARHPVDPEGRLRGVKGVWVADGSILPSCPGVNPQVSIMAIAAGVGEAAAQAR
ncbi:MAG TPA: GMC family oxidoreductase [Solirubrobacterales bacterium]|jgi:choline dehydrogenase-like flavoprotein|nr:GMC family oxidoreductase [Solirubrobacterales bacterium]